MNTCLALLLSMLLAAPASGQINNAELRDAYIMLRNSGGSDVMLTDGNVSTRHYQYKVPDQAGLFMDVARVNVVLEDGTLALDGFMGSAALTNGLLFQVVDTDSLTVLYDFTADKPIRTTADWAFLGGTDVELNGVGTTQRALVRWTIGKAGGNLRLTRGQFFRCVVQDKMTELTRMSIQIQGTGNFPVIPEAPPTDVVVPSLSTSPTLVGGIDSFTWHSGEASEDVVYNIRAVLGGDTDFKGFSLTFRPEIVGSMAVGFGGGLYTIHIKLEDPSFNQTSWTLVGKVTVLDTPG